MSRPTQSAGLFARLDSPPAQAVLPGIAIAGAHGGGRCQSPHRRGRATSRLPSPPSPSAAARSLELADISGPDVVDASITDAPARTSLTAAVSATSRKPGKVRHRDDVPFMKRQACAEFRSGCINRADIYYPTNAGPWPVIVTIHGRPRTPRDMAELADLAARGAVVFNVDYRGVRPVSKGFPESISDVACAIRYARQNATRYGGDRDHLVLVGHSMGGYVGAMVALAGDTFPRRPGPASRPWA